MVLPVLFLESTSRRRRSLLGCVRVCGDLCGLRSIHPLLLLSPTLVKGAIKMAIVLDSLRRPVWPNWNRIKDTRHDVIPPH